MRALLGGTLFTPSPVSQPFVLGKTVHWLAGHDKYWAIHEIGHVLDNAHASSFIAQVLLTSSIFGGGPSDEMITSLGGSPRSCFFRHSCKSYEPPMISEIYGLNSQDPKYYANGPSEDFAETFAIAGDKPRILRLTTCFVAHELDYPSGAAKTGVCRAALCAPAHCTTPTRTHPSQDSMTLIENAEENVQEAK